MTATKKSPFCYCCCSANAAEELLLLLLRAWVHHHDFNSHYSYSRPHTLTVVQENCVKVAIIEKTIQTMLATAKDGWLMSLWPLILYRCSTSTKVFKFFQHQRIPNEKKNHIFENSMTCQTCISVSALLSIFASVMKLSLTNERMRHLTDFNHCGKLQMKKSVLNNPWSCFSIHQILSLKKKSLNWKIQPKHCIIKTCSYVIAIDQRP